MSASEHQLGTVHVVPRIHDEASGPSQSVVALCRGLAGLGHKVELEVLTPQPPAVDRRVSLRVHRSLPLVYRFGGSISLWRALRNGVTGAAILHNHSLWMFPNIVPGLVVRNGSGARLVISPHGTLSPWALERSKWKKRVAWWLLGQRLALKRAHGFHATAESEAEDIRRLGFRQPIAIIPNGIEVPALPSADLRGPERTLLFLGRVHPIKGIDALLAAWSRQAPRFPAWRLVIAGPSDPAGYAAEIHALAARLGCERVAFPGPVYGEDKARAYAAADLFVLPTHSENFGLVVGEALAHGRPVITTREAPWSGLEEHGCGWWIEDSIPALTAALGEAMALDRATLDALGARGRAWMERDFGWDGIARQMGAFYLWLLGRGEMPACVVVN